MPLPQSQTWTRPETRIRPEIWKVRRILFPKPAGPSLELADLRDRVETLEAGLAELEPSPFVLRPTPEEIERYGRTP